MSATVCLLNQKGGVGKTSSCHHLSGALAKAGRRVLLVDNDPQASLTQGFWGPEATRAIDASASVAALYDPDFGAIPEALIRPTGFDAIHIVPGSGHLTPYNMLPPPSWTDSERGIAEFLAEVRRVLASVEETPRLYPVIRKDVRRALLRRFPYSILYLAEPEATVVLGCFHGSRDPRRWHRRR